MTGCYQEHCTVLCILHTQLLFVPIPASTLHMYMYHKLIMYLHNNYYVHMYIIIMYYYTCTSKN